MQQLPEKISAPLTPSLLLPAILSFVLLFPSLVNAQAVTTAQYDNARTGANLNEKILTPANVSEQLALDSDKLRAPLQEIRHKLCS